MKKTLCFRLLFVLKSNFQSVSKLRYTFGFSIFIRTDNVINFSTGICLLCEVPSSYQTLASLHNIMLAHSENRDLPAITTNNPLPMAFSNILIIIGSCISSITFSYVLFQHPSHSHLKKKVMRANSISFCILLQNVFTYII